MRIPQFNRHRPGGMERKNPLTQKTPRDARRAPRLFCECRCHCKEPTGRRFAPPEDRLRDAAIATGVGVAGTRLLPRGPGPRLAMTLALGAVRQKIAGASPASANSALTA
jgi:hypothetical protein